MPIPTPVIGGPLIGHTDSVTGVAYSPDGHRLASASARQHARLWNPDIDAIIRQPLIGHDDAVNAVAYSPNGHRLASGSDDMTVRLWNPDAGAAIGNPLKGHTAAVTSVAFSRMGIGWSAAAPTRRCDCGMSTPAPRSASRSRVTPTW